MNYKKLLEEKFNSLKDKWIVTSRKAGDECIGNTFEDLIGKKEDNLPIADFGDIEIKSHRITTGSKVSLFSKSPKGRGINSKLRTKYGLPDEEKPEYNILYPVVSTQKYTQYKDGYKFKLIVDDENQKIWLFIKDKNDIMVEDNTTGIQGGIYWPYEYIQKVVNKKLKNIAIVYGEEKTENGKHKVRFSDLKIITGISFEMILDKIKNGQIVLELRLGVFKSGENEGKHHDHGSSFRITLENLLTIKESC